MRPLGLAAVAFLLAACGGAATAAVSTPEYETIVTRHLDSIAEPLAELEGVDDYRPLVDTLEEGAERAHDAVERLREIDPPPGLHGENEALITALAVLEEDFRRIAETLTALQEEGMPPEYPALLETLGAIGFEGVELLRDALLALRNAGIEPGAAGS